MHYDSDIIDLLCTRAGTIMEDCASMAILRDGAEQDARIEMIATAGRDILALAQAASVISARKF